MLRNNRFAAISSKFLSAGLSFIFVWSVAFVLDAKTAGIFLYSYMLMTVLVQLARAGTENSMLRVIQRDMGRSETISKISIFVVYVAGITLALGLIVFQLLALDLFPVYQELSARYTLGLFWFLAVIFGISQVFGSYFQINFNVYSQYWALAIFVSVAGCIVSGISYVSGEYKGIISYTYTFVLVSFLCFLITLILLRRSILRKTRNDHIRESIWSKKSFSVVKFTFPFALLTFIHMTTQWGAQVISGAWLAEEELAQLSIATRLAMLASFVFLALNALLAPMFSSLYSENRQDQFEEIAIRSVSLSNFFAITLVAVFVMFGRNILGLFGHEYIAAYETLIILSLGWLVCVLVGPTSEILLMTDRTKEVKHSLVIASCVTVALSILLIPKFHIEGAAIANASGLIALSVQNQYKVKKAFGINFLSLTALSHQVGSVIGLLRAHDWQLKKGKFNAE